MAAAAIAFMPALLASCSVDSPTRPLVPIEQTNFASSLGVDLGKSTKTTNGAYYRDVVAGNGATVVNGQLITVRYTGYFADGSIFDSNVSEPTPQIFPIGVGRVIPGWDEAVPGMKVGGTRQLIIPPSLGYGPYDYGTIPGNSVLVFTVQVIAAQ
jgi:peptidylprolyl isomerase